MNFSVGEHAGWVIPSRGILCMGATVRGRNNVIRNKVSGVGIGYVGMCCCGYDYNRKH